MVKLRACQFGLLGWVLLGLTKSAPRRIVKKMKETARLPAAIGATLLLCAFFGLRAQDPPPGQDGRPIRRPDTDYMSQWANRNTKSLGIGGEDKIFKKLSGQPQVNWAVRSAVRHILD